MVNGMGSKIPHLSYFAAKPWFSHLWNEDSYLVWLCVLKAIIYIKCISVVDSELSLLLLF